MQIGITHLYFKILSIFMYSISNNVVSIEVNNRGAELQSLYHKQHGIEYMWTADPAYWAKKSPVLFLIVGGLKENTYDYAGKAYQLNRHGFARENDFDLSEQSSDSLTFSLKGNEQTKLVYPFDFLFSVKYTLEENKLHVSFIVENTGDENMWFSAGAHPAFAVPLVEGTTYEDYYLQFDEAENADRWTLSKDGLIEKAIPFLHDQSTLPLKKELFYKDAIVFKDLRSSSIAIASDKTQHGVKVGFTGFPYMGIWAAKDAGFVCIEPWCGIADSVHSSGKLEDKEGTISLAVRRQFERTYSIEVY